MHDNTGKFLFGSTNSIPGVGHVATVFAHVLFIPVYPIESRFVFEDQEADADSLGLVIPFDSRSVACGYLQGASWLLIVVGLVLAGKWFLRSHVDAAGLGLGVLPLGILGFVLTQVLFVGQATYERAQEIASAISMPKRQQIKLALAYGKITPGAASEALALAEAEIGRKRAKREQAQEARRAAKRTARALKRGPGNPVLRSKAPRRRGLADRP